MSESLPVPDHVPPEMVSDFSFWTAPGMAPTPNGDPQAALSGLHQGPPIFYARNNRVDGGGTWVLTRAADQRRVLQDAETFSSNRGMHAKTVAEDWRLIPLESDPPSHGHYRSMLNPLLSPKRVTAMQEGIRARAAALIEGLRPKGGCEAMEDFAFPFAVGTFLQFLGLPESRSGEFLGWAEKLLHGTPDERGGAMRTIKGFMDELVQLRRREPADDFMTFVVQARADGRLLSDDEATGMGALLFVAGLDTVAAAIGFDLAYLARHPAEQARLRADPNLIKPAIEELLRAYSTVQMLRVATRDVVIEGAPIKAGDFVSCGAMVANRDPEEFPDPDVIDLNRDNNRHMAFAFGPHRCLGSHLARRELVIGLEEWLARLPPFRLREDAPPITNGGYVFGIQNLMLDWS